MRIGFVLAAGSRPGDAARDEALDLGCSLWLAGHTCIVLTPPVADLLEALRRRRLPAVTIPTLATRAGPRRWLGAVVQIKSELARFRPEIVALPSERGGVATFAARIVARYRGVPAVRTSVLASVTERHRRADAGPAESLHERPLAHLCGDAFAASCDARWSPGLPAPREGTVFVDVDDVPAFFAAAARAPERRYVLVSHNGDTPIDGQLVDRRPDNVVHWFGCNRAVERPGLDALPLGIANPRWRHGELGVVEAHRGRPREGRRLLLVQHGVGTNPGPRRACLEAFAAQPWATVRCHEPGQQPAEFSDYVEALAAHRFVACPVGNGPDTHRLWEALYLRTVPVCLDHVALRPFGEVGMPIAWVDDWRRVSPEWLARQEKRLDRPEVWARTERLLRLTAWERRIERTAMHLRAAPGDTAARGLR